MLSLRDNFETLREHLAIRRPVLVVGAGCQRVGYDDPKSAAWAEVQRRLALLRGTVGADKTATEFLDRFWRSKLSDEVLEPLSAEDDLPLDHQIEQVPLAGDLGLVDQIRIEALANPLLKCLAASTRCLGLVVSRGVTPVISWNDVEHRPSKGRSADPAAAQRKVAAENLGTFVANAEKLNAWRLGETNSVARQANELFKFAEHPGEVEELRRILDILRLRNVVERTRWLSENALPAHNKQIPLSGALVEWLADLLWHLLTSDAGVPPSQAELAFYVNLRGSEPRRRYYSRSRPGELRITAGELAANEREADITAAVAARIADGAKRAIAQTRWQHDAPLRVARTLAAQLWTMSETGTPDDEFEGDGAPEVKPLPVALVTSYDLSLERQLLEIAEPGDCFHTIVPVWVGADPRSRELRWLCGTYTRTRATVVFDDVTGANKKTLRWDWFGHGQAADAGVLGPVVVRLNGAPQLQFAPAATGRSLGCGSPATAPPLHHDEPLRLATVFAEFDTVRAISSFRGARGERGSRGSHFADRVVSAVDWSARSWAFFGDSLPDWLARLRLLLNVADGRDSGRDVRRVAIDRAFDWPEEGLLEALDVKAYLGDLKALPDLPGIAFLNEPDATATFFADLERHLPWRAA